MVTVGVLIASGTMIFWTLDVCALNAQEVETLHHLLLGLHP
jgi:hypothetical protein